MNTVYCPFCGSLNNCTSKFCSKCGNSLLNTTTPNNIDRKTKSSSVIWATVVIVVVLCCIAFPFQNESIESRLSNYSLLNTEISQCSIQSIKDIDEMRGAIDNTIWTHTEVGDLFWTKLEFKGGKVRIYNAMPSDGKWTFEEECPYSLEEGRFIDDGRRYIAAVIKTKDMSIFPKFVITNGHLSWLGFLDAGGFVLGDYEWD